MDVPPDMPCDVPYPLDKPDTLDWYRSPVVAWLNAHPDMLSQTEDIALFHAYFALFRRKPAADTGTSK